MRINIIFEFKEEATGGGNQFLKALKKYFISNEVYTDSIKEADVVLFNSYQYIPQVLETKLRYPDKIFIHRIDGPIRLYHKMSDLRDDIINFVNRIIADGTVFQTEWSKANNYKLGLSKSPYDVTILNAPDDTIFNKCNRKQFFVNEKIRIIATSWSKNIKKGFEAYKWLDNNLDFDKYKMVFVGRTPVEFNNIEHIKPLNSKQLAAELKKSDIYITASQKDPCSNSLIEATHCGLPVLALNDGGHPEIVRNSGLLFNDYKDIPDLLDKIEKNYCFFSKNTNLPHTDQIGDMYLDFFRKLYEDVKVEKYGVRDFSKQDYIACYKKLKYAKLLPSGKDRCINFLKKIIKLVQR